MLLMKRVLLLFGVISICLSGFSSTRYVTQIAAGIGDGSTWLNASADIQAMIDSSLAGDTVWVAAGTYYPTSDPLGNPSPADPRDKTFALKNGVKVFGSFAGTEASLSQRTLAVINANASVLSGDIGIEVV